MHEVFTYGWFWVRLAALTDTSNLPAAPRDVALAPGLKTLIRDAFMPELATVADSEQALSDPELATVADSVNQAPRGLVGSQLPGTGSQLPARGPGAGPWGEGVKEAAISHRTRGGARTAAWSCARGW